MMDNMVRRGNSKSWGKGDYLSYGDDSLVYVDDIPYLHL